MAVDDISDEDSHSCTYATDPWTKKNREGTWNEYLGPKSHPKDSNREQRPQSAQGSVQRSVQRGRRHLQRILSHSRSQEARGALSLRLP